MRYVDANYESWSAWREYAEDAAVGAALRGLYVELDAAVTARGPTCWTSGKCCDFGAYGHRLYVTALEVAWFLKEVRRAEDGVRRADGSTSILSLPQLSSDETGDVCPYQLDKLCSAHLIRPLGCRVFFCQRGTEEWQQELYETFLSRLRGLHDAFGIEYRYLDWMAGLREAEEALAVSR